MAEQPPFDQNKDTSGHFVGHPKFTAILDRIDEIHTMSMQRREPYGASLEGPTGAGKSSILDTLERRNPVRETPEGFERPFFRMETPSPVTIKGFVRDMLDLMGDPCADRGTLPQLTRRLIGLIRDSKVEYLAFDDFQHLYDTKTALVLTDVSEWLKALIKEVKITVIVTGVNSTMETILESNQQLSRLFPARLKLEPYSWDEQESKQNFIHLVQAIIRLENMGLQPSNNEELYRRLHYATSGVVGYVVLLVAYIATCLRRQGSNVITLEVLEMGFENALCQHLKTKINPFKTQLTEKFIPPPEPGCNGKNDKPNSLTI